VQPANGLPDIAGWEAQILQLVALTREPAVGLAQEWWHDLTGQDPESLKKRNHREDRGRFNDTTLSCTVDLVRVHWCLAPALQVESLADVPDKIPSLGPYIDKQEWFRDLMLRWLPSCPPVTRIGFVANLIRYTEDHAQSYEQLGSYLQHAVNVDPESSDLHYRINRRRPAPNMGELSINRLSKWSAIKFVVGLQTGFPGSPEPGKQLAHSELYGVSLELDINTAPEHTEELAHDRLPGLLHSMVDFATEIAELGDVR
jgi:hypothetical protein